MTCNQLQVCDTYARTDARARTPGAQAMLAAVVLSSGISARVFISQRMGGA